MQRTDDGLAFEDGRLTLVDGREIAWRWWGDSSGTPVLRFQGTPGSRIARNPDARIQQELGARYLMADRPGYGASTRKPGRGIADFADDIRSLLDAQGVDRVPVMGTSGGGPHALAMAAMLPDRVSAVTVVVGAAPLVSAEVEGLVGVNAESYALAEKGWAPLHEFLAQVRIRLLSEEGMQGVLGDAPEVDRDIMQSPAWQRMSRENLGEALRPGAEGWTDESLALHADWDFDLARVRASVTWWHGDDDMNAPISAARRTIARLHHADLRLWHAEGHFASLLHEREIVQELLTRDAAS